jgi:vitamin B12 transporter
MKRALMAVIVACQVLFGLIAYAADNQAPQESTDTKESTTAGGTEETAAVPEPNLGEVVVTATKIPEPTGDIPASVQVITSEDIKNSTAKDAGDLIAEAGLGHVQKYNGDLTSQVEIRGLSTDLFTEAESRVLVLVNGNPAGTTNLAKIPVEDIERVEIVKGPASVLYGSSAMGGVINIITKQGVGGFNGSVGVEGGSWDYVKTMAELSGTKGKFDYYLMGDRSSSGDYAAKHYGTIQNTSTNDDSVSARIGYQLFDKDRIELGFQHWNGWNIGSPGPTYAPTPDAYTTLDREAFDVGFKTDTLNVKYYYTYNRDDSWSPANMMGYGPGNSSLFRSTSRDQGVRVENVFPIGDHRIIVGAQWARSAVDTSTNNGSPYYPDSLYNNYALFTEGRLSLMNNKLLINAGLRYDYFDDKTLSTPGLTGTPISANLDHFNPRGGIVYKVFDGLSLKGSVGTAFRAPSPLELASNYTLFGYQTLGNAHLKAESSTTYEAGFEYAKNLLKSGFTFFETYFTNEITSYYDSALSASTYKNLAGTTTIQGIEINASYDAGLAAGLGMSIEPFTNVTYKTRYNSSDPTLAQSTGGHLTYTPNWTGEFGVKVGQKKWDCRLILNYVGSEYVTDYSAAPYPTINKGGFAVVNLKGSYRPIKNLELTASVGNLLDREYAYVLGYPMAERSFTGGVKWLF